MRTTILLVTISLSCVFNYAAGQSSSLLNIQKNIDSAFYNAVKTNNVDALVNIENQLNKSKEPLAAYWQAYAAYYVSIYYLKTGDKEKSKQAVNAGIDRLLRIEEKNSDDYALFGIMQGFSIQFTPTVADIIDQSMEVSSNIQEALALDKDNLRAYLAAATNDYYTPKEYGGGEKAEGYLLKAVAIDEKSKFKTALPTWGKDQAYIMLITLYISKKDKESASKYLNEALKHYPNNQKLIELTNAIKEI